MYVSKEHSVSERITWEYRDYTCFYGKYATEPGMPGPESYAAWLSGLNGLGATGWEVVGQVELYPHRRIGPPQPSPSLLLKRRVT
jgi:hypothetical protein